MVVLKCKMCGGDLNVQEGLTVAECEYCGTKQTVPTVDDEKKVTLFGRANRLRLACEFDKAAGVYEALVADFPDEAEAYWGLVLCKYGIEYVDDPATGKKIPTCHRSSFDSVMEDSDFEQAMENANAEARFIYREEAKRIEELRRGIVAVSSSEEPYDIFICYKETDANGNRTVDSEIAQDVYTALTDKGYRVFFARISLEDKLGQAYEPYIFAALNSAKVMLAFGTDYEYFNAVWVKNEWSRFLQLIAKGEKKTLIPCYKGVDAYDIPKEFAKLQAQDMGKVGAMQDLVRGIEKILPRTAAPVVQQMVAPSASNATVDSLLKRVFLFLEDENWESADEYCEKVLDIDPENGRAYLGKMLAKRQLTEPSLLGESEYDFSEADDYQKVLRFGDLPLVTEVEGYCQRVKDRELARQRAEEEKERAIALELASREEALAPKRRQAAKLSKWIGCCGVITIMHPNGTAEAVYTGTYGEGQVGSWRNLTAISTGETHTVGLKADGTVVAAGKNEEGQCNVGDWRDIVAISAERAYHTVGLKADGTVVATGKNDRGQCNVGDWRDIVAVAVSHFVTVGLKKDGTVVSTLGNELGYKLAREEIAKLSDLVSISVLEYQDVVGLKSNGTVVATGKFAGYVADWRDIVAISSGNGTVIGLKSDGTVAVWHNDIAKNMYKANSWKNIVGISCRDYDAVGLTEDGRVVMTSEYFTEEAAQLRAFNHASTIEAECEAAREAVRVAAQRRASGVCQYCGGTFKGLFSKKCANCGKEKDY